MPGGLIERKSFRSARWAINFTHLAGTVAFFLAPQFR
jgi:hypothetical protein